MTVSKKYNRGRFSIDHHEFQKGGDGDVKFCNFIGDSSQGFKVPAKSLMIQNHGGGAGENYLYYRTIHTNLGTSATSRLSADEFINYQLGEAVFWGVLLWSSNANLEFSLDATPGEWTDLEVSEYINNPVVKKRIDSLDDLGLSSSLVI